MSIGRRGLIVAPLIAAAMPEPAVLALGKAMTVLAPSSTGFAQGMGDSIVAGTLVGPGFNLTVDLSVNADPLTGNEDGPPIRSADIVIDGRAGRFFVWRTARGGGPFRIGLHVPVVAQSVMGAVRLTIAGSAATGDAADAAQTMLGTLRFTDAF